MSVTNSETGTSIDEIADGIYRISTPLPPNPALPTGFTFNQFLVVDEEPLLFHTGPRRMFPLVRDAVAAVMQVGQTALGLVLSSRSGRKRIARGMAGRSAACRTALWSHWSHDID